MSRKLNMAFAADFAKIGGASALSYLYEEIAGQAVVDATAGDGRFSPFDIALQLMVGWGPFVLASYQGGPFWAAFAGATAFNRIDNIVYALGGRSITHVGPGLPGETLEQTRARIGA